MEKVLYFNKSLYPKEAIMKAAYHFIDRCFIHVGVNSDEYIVTVSSKKGFVIEDLSNEFFNELLAQTVRYQVYQQTHTLREILMARAMSSTITGSSSELEASPMPDQIDNLENILMDWFEKNEK